jgi:hypothetical protein
MLSALTSPFTNCCARVATYCSENREGLKTAVKVHIYIIALCGALFLPIPGPARGAIAFPLGFLALNTLISHSACPASTDKKWVRMSTALALNAGAGTGIFGAPGMIEIGGAALSWFFGLYVMRSACCSNPDDYAAIVEINSPPQRLPDIPEEPIELDDHQ